MNFNQFIKVSINMVILYHNKYVNDGVTIEEDDVCIRHQINNNEEYFSIMYIMGNPDINYVVKYDKKTKTLKSYLTEKIDDIKR